MKLSDEKLPVRDMPKLESPFIRDFNAKGEYVCQPKIDDDYRWAFTRESRAVAKIDGTNVSIYVGESGIIENLYNRTQEIVPFSKGSERFMEGLMEAMRCEYIPTVKGQYFGELIGPTVNGNPYKLERHLWVPISLLQEKYVFKFWDEFVIDLENKSDQEIYDKISELFKGLWCPYKRSKGITGTCTSDMGFEGICCEGIVFYKKQSGPAESEASGSSASGSIRPKMCKLRRDMFDWFKGRRHEQKKKRT